MRPDGAPQYDVLIIGGGVIGCGTARELANRCPGLKICLLEKEPDLALHQSGRNSGVVHVGYNQKPGTMKARFVVEGSRRLREYCRNRGVAVVEDGILILARNEAEEATLDILRQRAEQNGAEVRLISRPELLEREPEATTATAALLAPGGASFDSRSYVLALAEDARQAGVEIRTSHAVRDLSESDRGVQIETGRGSLEARLVINCAGLHADRIAQQLGAGRDLRIVPFLGFYSELIPERRDLVRSHLYPAPDLEFPFLGVHLSRTFDGRVLVGPGSSLALGRESYERGKANAADLIETFTYPGFLRLLGKPRFRQLVRQEWKKSVSRKAVAEEARRLVPALRDEDLMAGRAGIRAQLVDTAGSLVDDLRIERTARSIHVLNAVSPALTCSLPFADHLANLALEGL